MTLTLEAEQMPHLILHFDVNKTLIASDKTENKSIEQVINELLSRKYSACWDETVSEPLTFDAYVKTVLLPGPEHDIRLKEARLAYLIRFTDYLKERNHPLYPTVLAELNLILDNLNRAEGNVFPSFYRLIFALNQNQIPYTLFLRSFGHEVFEVKNEINLALEDLFQIEGEFKKRDLHLNGKEVLSESQAIHDFFNARQHAAIHDDWVYWVEGKMDARYGKPVYIDQEDKNVLTIFFDDNIKIDASEKNIIAPFDPKEKAFLSIPQLIQLNQLVRVDTLEAILNENYYLELVQEALKKHQAIEQPGSISLDTP